MSDTTTPQVPAGWYPDPEGGPRPRWWDGSQWTAQYADPTPASAVPAYAASAPAYSVTGELTAPAGAKTNTVWIWLMIVLPLLVLLPLLAVDWPHVIGGTTELVSSPAMIIGLAASLLSLPLVILFGYLDYRALVSAGVPQPFHWAFSFFYLVVSTTAVYVIGRAVVVRRRTGSGLAPLWAQIVVLLLSWVVSGVLVAQIFDATVAAGNIGGLG